MSASQDRLIEAAVRPISDNAEIKLAATHLLEEITTTEPVGTENAIARWEAADSKKRRLTGRRALWASLLVISATVWLAESGDIIDFYRMVGVMKGVPSALRDAEMRIASKLDARQKTLLFGDVTATSGADRIKARLRSDLDNPAYFAEYAEQDAQFTDRQLIQETGLRIDPDNAWFTYLAVKRDGNSLISVCDGSLSDLDEVKHDRQLIRTARDQTKCTSYFTEILSKRLPLLPHGNLREYVDLLTLRPSRYNYYYLRPRFDGIARTIADEALEIESAGQFYELSKDGDLFLRRMVQEDARKISSAQTWEAVVILSERLATAAKSLGIREEADHWQKRVTLLTNRRIFLKDQETLIVDGKSVKGEDVSGLLAGYVIYSTYHQALAQPPLTDGDLKPGRMLDHAVLSWLCVHACWVLLGLGLALMAVYRLRGSILTRRLAGRMEDLLSAADWVWISGLGVLLPFAYVMAVNRLTPLGGMEFGMYRVGLLMPTAHFLALLILWLIVSLHVIRWRLARKAGMFGFSKPSWMSWLAVACAVAFVPLAGWAVITHAFGAWEDWLIWQHPKEWHLPGWSAFLLPGWFAILALGICLLWLGALAFLALFSRPERQMHRTASSRILGRTLAVAMIALILAAPAFKASERYWFTQDKLCKIDPSLPAWSVYEYKVAEQQKKELREILGDEP